MNRYCCCLASAVIVLAGGCGPTFRDHSAHGGHMLEQGRYAAARGHFLAAHEMVPENAHNLCNLAQCHIGLARDYLLRENKRAAARELDQAIIYYRRAIRSYPSYGPALKGLNEALEMRGLSTHALATAEWATEVVGPAVAQQLFLAREYAERGDADKALLAYKQAVAMEPYNPTPYWAMGLFYLRIDQREQAIAQLQQAYRLAPDRRYVADELRRLGAEVPHVEWDHSG